MSMPFLPEEIVFKILFLLPAQVLHNVMRLVCRSWCKLIREPVFTQAHLSESTNNSSMFKVVRFGWYFEVCSLNKDGTTWKRLRRFNQEYLTHGDGLILTHDSHNRLILELVNPITNQMLILPNSPTKYHLRTEDCAVAYSPSTSKYKVVCICYKRVYIVTVGVDKEWREILVELDFMPLVSKYGPQGAQGLVYWYCLYEKSVIILDLEEEIFHKADFLEKVKGSAKTATSIRSDMIPSFIIKQNYRCWHFWELVNHKNGGEWRKLGILDFENEWGKINELAGLQFNNMPPDTLSVLGLKNRDEALFKYRGTDYYRYFTYNFKTGIISWSFKNDSNYPRSLKLMLTNSLIVL